MNMDVCVTAGGYLIVEEGNSMSMLVPGTRGLQREVARRFASGIRMPQQVWRLENGVSSVSE